ncbi:Nin1 binding protein [Geranomyces variabilis]|uniref:20S-pre-rRNA D-site endonuclease NOB1 n=1 Tax=Geranomyces variabilis TaxID=109894 RepID=A0AAD5TCZ1_9FUNG|nr:Nin1 binding protein [Geranomyces variabilis]
MSPVTEGRSSVTSSITNGRDNVTTLVVDSAPLIKLTPIGHLAQRFVTVQEVISEIRDPRAREHLAQLPFKLETRVPSADAMQAVVSFAKKTGDFSVLSAVDLKVLALTYMMEKEAKKGVAHLRTELATPKTPPPRQQQKEAKPQGSSPANVEGTAAAAAANDKAETMPVRESLSGAPVDAAEAKAALDAQLQSADSEEETENAEAEEELVEDGESEQGEETDEEEESGEEEEESDEEEDSGDSSEEEVEVVLSDNPPEAETTAAESNAEQPALTATSSSTTITPPTAAEQAAEQSDDGEWATAKSRSRPRQRNTLPDLGDEEGWITPENIAQKKSALAGVSGRNKHGPRARKPENIAVACITADFAMQNVLLQLGLRLLSVDGVAVKTIKSFVLRCHACYKVTKDMEKKFCPACGNNTLMRTTVGVDSRGNVTYYLKKNFQYNNRGTKYSIKEPKGGRRANDMLLREDQREYVRAVNYQKRAKQAQLDDAFDPDHVLLDSRKSQPGLLAGMPVIGHGRKNVNHAKKSRQKRR